MVRVISLSARRLEIAASSASLSRGMKFVTSVLKPRRMAQNTTIPSTAATKRSRGAAPLTAPASRTASAVRRD
jgi:hypothetical protein